MNTEILFGDDLSASTASIVVRHSDLDGKKRYKVEGFLMAWCSSIQEATRVASILSRIQRTDSLRYACVQ